MTEPKQAPDQPPLMPERPLMAIAVGNIQGSILIDSLGVLVLEVPVGTPKGRTTVRFSVDQILHLRCLLGEGLRMMIQHLPLAGPLQPKEE